MQVPPLTRKGTHKSKGVRARVKGRQQQRQEQAFTGKVSRGAASLLSLLDRQVLIFSLLLSRHGFNTVLPLLSHMIYSQTALAMVSQ